MFWLHMNMTALTENLLTLTLTVSRCSILSYRLYQPYIFILPIKWLFYSADKKISPCLNSMFVPDWLQDEHDRLTKPRVRCFHQDEYVALGKGGLAGLFGVTVRRWHIALIAETRWRRRLGRERCGQRVRRRDSLERHAVGKDDKRQGAEPESDEEYPCQRQVSD